MIKLVGVDLIAPCSVKIRDELGIEPPVSLFVENVVPRQFFRGSAAENATLTGA